MSDDPLLVKRNATRSDAMRRMALSIPAVIGYVAATVAAVAFHWAIMPVGFVVILGFCWSRASREAHDHWWGELAEHFGMRVGPPLLPEPYGATPLLRSGDERKVTDLASDGERTLLRYVSTDVTQDSDGRRQTHDHHYTLVVYADPPPPQPIRFLAAHERMLMGLKDDRRGRLPYDVDDHDLESAALNKRFTVRISDEHARRLGEVFEPAFMLWFAEHAHPFEYDNGLLVVYEARRLDGTAAHADLLEDAARIRARLRDAMGAPLPAGELPPPRRAPGGASIPPPPAG